MQSELPHSKIKHLVVLMLENRGFDHLMGWLYGADEQPRFLSANGSPLNGPFDGLSWKAPEDLDRLANPLPSSSRSVAPIKGARSPMTPKFNPGEHFPHIMNQMWGQAHGPEKWLDAKTRRGITAGRREPPMTGYILDYDKEVRHATGSNVPPDEATLSEIMETYLPEQLPVLSGLARNYAVSDRWFCSVPSQTNTNRAFSMAGTSRGLVNNSFYDPPFRNPGVEMFRLAQGLQQGGLALLNPWSGKEFKKGVSHSDALPASTRCLFEVLQENGISWKVFWQATWPPQTVALGAAYQYVRTMFPLLMQSGFDANFVQFDGDEDSNAFFSAISNDELPAVSWIEPRWGGGASWNSSVQTDGNDFHPVADTTVGEDFVMRIYNALTRTPAVWSKTLLVITFDENGGTYDHVPPPTAQPSGLDRCPLPDPKFCDAGMDPETRTQFGFDFTQYGIRVPTLLVSPYIGPNVIFRSGSAVPYDHTSIIATTLKLAGVPPALWNLGARVAAAPTFEGLISEQAREEVISKPDRALAVPASPSGEHAPLLTNQEYIFELVGSRWPTVGRPLYLGNDLVQREEQNGGPEPTRYLCPGLIDDRQRAARFKLAPLEGSQERTTLRNMSRYRIQKVTGPLAGFYVCGDGPVVYYQVRSSAPDTCWQVRLLHSRDPDTPVKVEEDLYFAAPTTTKSHRCQRLAQHATRNGWLAIRAGDWAIWRVLAVAH